MCLLAHSVIPEVWVVLTILDSVPGLGSEVLSACTQHAQAWYTPHSHHGAKQSFRTWESPAVAIWRGKQRGLRRGRWRRACRRRGRWRWARS